MNSLNLTHCSDASLQCGITSILCLNFHSNLIAKLLNSIALISQF